MLKRIRRVIKAYWQLGFVLIMIIAGGILDLLGQDTLSHWILGIGSSLIVVPLLWGMVEDIRSGKYGIDILAATAIITSVILHEYWAAIVIAVMLTGGAALENFAEMRAQNELSDLLKRKPKKTHLLQGRKQINVNVHDVNAGDKLLILAGEVVPVDCIITDGQSSFDESSLTGEALPVAKIIGEQLLSGSVNIEGTVTVRALETAGNSQYEQIIKLVRSAASSQSPFVRLADRYSIPFTLVSFIIAGCAWFISGDVLRFLQVLVVATPCPLLLGAPIALISGMMRAARHGIIIKTGSAIERLAEIKTMAFDKTGTLTHGTPVVGNIAAFHTYTSNEVLAYAAALEQYSNHVLAKAILNAAQDKKLKIPKAKHTREDAGNGLEARIQGKRVLVGRLSVIKAAGIMLPKNFKPSTIKETSTYVAVDDQLAGVISFSDELRPESKSTLVRLKSAGIEHTLIVTGDSESAAKRVARELGIEDVQADCLPADKMRAIEEIKYHPVAFVGDGVNDAPVLTAADVGIALGARGSTAASESADVVILHDDISKVASAVEIANRTFYIAKQSILIGIFISIGLMGVFATGRFKPVYGAALQELVDVAVIFNALRAHGSFRKSKNQY